MFDFRHFQRFDSEGSNLASGISVHLQVLNLSIVSLLYHA